MNKIKDENYIVIQGWMVNELGLKGNSLLIYAIIYGFSQSESQRFTGSLQYLADWTSSTKQGVMKCLKTLIDDGHICKEERYVNNVKFVEYYTTKFNGGMQQSLPNNIDNNLDKKEIYKEKIEEIISYLNEKTEKNFKSNTKNTVDFINGRLNEGYTIEDFKKVIDNKVNDWKDDPINDAYLRPSTLFRPSNFENYLNQKSIPKQPKESSSKGMSIYEQLKQYG